MNLWLILQLQSHASWVVPSVWTPRNWKKSEVDAGFLEAEENQAASETASNLQ